MDILIKAWEDGYQFSSELKFAARANIEGIELGKYLEKYFIKLDELESKVNPILDKAHKQAGKKWRGREEAAGLIRERP